MKQQTFKVYEYPIKHPNGTYFYGSYTIKADVEPKHFKHEKLVAKFTATVLEDGEVNLMKVNSLSELIEKAGY